MKKRLFLAINPGEDIKRILDNYTHSDGFKDAIASGKGRITPRENLHITLVFIGYMDEKNIPGLILELSSISSNAGTFFLYPDRIIPAPPHKSSRMIWLTFRECQEFQSAAGFLKTSVGKYALANAFRVKLDNRDAFPHITLVRFKEVPVVKDTLLPVENIGQKKIRVKSIDLMESVLSATGPKYSVLKRFFLENR